MFCKILYHILDSSCIADFLTLIPAFMQLAGNADALYNCIITAVQFCKGVECSAVFLLFGQADAELYTHNIYLQVLDRFSCHDSNLCQSTVTKEKLNMIYIALIN